MTEQCRPVEADGQIIPVLGDQPMTEEDRGHFATIVRAAREKMRMDRIKEDIAVEFGVDYDETNREHEVFVAGWKAAAEHFTAEPERPRRRTRDHE